MQLNAIQENNIMHAQQEVEVFKTFFDAAKTELRKSFFGHDSLVENLLAAFFAGGHVLLEGVPGLGKTVLARTLSQTMELSYERIQCTPDLMPADIIGHMTLLETDTGAHELTYQQGPVVSNFVLVDEINRANPKTQSALLEAMQESQVTVGRKIIKLPSPNIFVATQNPVEQEGTYHLPEAQLDRFLVKLIVDYPTSEDYHQIIQQTTGTDSAQPESIIPAQQTIELRKTVRKVQVCKSVLDYAINLVVMSQPQNTSIDFVKKNVQLGASTRAIQSLILMAKVKALLDLRTSVSCQDIKSIAYEVLRHRIIPVFSAQASGINSETIIQTILKNTKHIG